MTDTFSMGHIFDGTYYRRDIFSTFPDSIAFYLKWHFKLKIKLIRLNLIKIAEHRKHPGSFLINLFK